MDGGELKRAAALYWIQVMTTTFLCILLYNNNNNNNNFISIALLSYVQGALQSCKQHYWKIFTNLQPYPIIFTMGKKGKKLKLKQLLNRIHNDKKREKIKTNAIYTNL